MSMVGLLWLDMYSYLCSALCLFPDTSLSATQKQIKSTLKKTLQVGKPNFASDKKQYILVKVQIGEINALNLMHRNF